MTVCELIVTGNRWELESSRAAAYNDVYQNKRRSAQ